MNEPVGAMPMPADFKYKDVFLRGKPRHVKYDSFWLRHPPMVVRRWAKIYAPFDALSGFDECIDSKKVLYCSKRELSNSEKSAVEEKLSALHSLTINSPAYRKNRPEISVTFFEPCNDELSEWYESGGRYKTVNGLCRKVDTLNRTIHVIEETGEVTINLDDITSITDGRICQPINCAEQ